MSATSYDGSYDSGHNHVWPAIVAILVTAAFVVGTVFIAGPPL
jgi:hypothetical protein